MTTALKVLVAAALILSAAPALAAKKALGASERIDVNRAGVVELQRLPGVGEKRAQAIVAARAKQPFKRAEDLLTVKGIGASWLTKVRNNLQVGAATTAPSPAAAPAPVAPPAPARR